MATSIRHRRVCAGIVLCAALIASCSRWRQTDSFRGWALFEMPGEGVESVAFEAAFAPALEAVETQLGSFDRTVAVHAWDGSVRITDEGRRHVHSSDDNGVHDVPGIGPAKIQAYHARGGAFGENGVFIGSPDPGTAVHELVHARFDEDGVKLPLWFEEGVACIMGDGVLFEGRWTIDGLACWPLRELREELLDRDQVERLMKIQATDQADVRDNVLVHFLGWAVLFDLYRETGTVEWEEWLTHFQGSDAVDEALFRLNRTLARGTENDWIQGLRSADPAQRLATAKGLWKLRSRPVLDQLVNALQRETHDEVRAGLAINALATAGEIAITWRHWRYLREVVSRCLDQTTLSDPAEQAALKQLQAAYSEQGQEAAAQDALQELARFWRE